MHCIILLQRHRLQNDAYRPGPPTKTTSQKQRYESMCTIFLGLWTQMVCSMQQSMRHSLYHPFCLKVSLHHNILNNNISTSSTMGGPNRRWWCWSWRCWWRWWRHCGHNHCNNTNLTACICMATHVISLPNLPCVMTCNLLSLRSPEVCYVLCCMMLSACCSGLMCHKFHGDVRHKQREHDRIYSGIPQRCQQ